MVGHYKRSKYLAEEIVREFIKQGLPVVTVNPAAPVGVGDHKPTQTGKMILDFLNGKMPAYVDTGLTIVDVDDVAEGHLLAMEKGKVSERYILGGENLSLKQVLECKPEQRRSPRIRKPDTKRQIIGTNSNSRTDFVIDGREARKRKKEPKKSHLF